MKSIVWGSWKNKTALQEKLYWSNKKVSWHPSPLLPLRARTHKWREKTKSLNAHGQQVKVELATVLRAITPPRILTTLAGSQEKHSNWSWDLLPSNAETQRLDRRIWFWGLKTLWLSGAWAKLYLKTKKIKWMWHFLCIKCRGANLFHTYGNTDIQMHAKYIQKTI